MRGRFIPFTGRETAWSDWQAVLTDNVGINRQELDPDLIRLFDQLDITKQASIAAGLRRIEQILEQQGQSINGLFAHSEAADGRILRAVGARVGSSMARVLEIVEANADDFSALAQVLQVLTAETEDGLAQGTLRFVASAAPAGVAARFSVEVRATVGDTWADAGFFLDAGVTALAGGSRIMLKADQVFFEVPGGATIYEDGKWTAVDGLMEFSLVDGYIAIDDGL